jgi:hypothetical protein
MSAILDLVKNPDPVSIFTHTTNSDNTVFYILKLMLQAKTFCTT